MSIPGISFQVFDIYVWIDRMSSTVKTDHWIVYEEKRSIKMMVTPLAKTGYDGRELK